MGVVEQGADLDDSRMCSVQPSASGARPYVVVMFTFPPLKQARKEEHVSNQIGARGCHHQEEDSHN